MVPTEQTADLERVSCLVHSWRQRGESVVFTNGCFDLLHRGHRRLLDHARRLGQHLIVAINSDDYCYRVKGPNRPVDSIARRCQCVQAASRADIVIPLAESDPCTLLRLLRPDFYVLGSDYRGINVPGLEYCGQVVFVERLPGMSTTEILATGCSSGATQ